MHRTYRYAPVIAILSATAGLLFPLLGGALEMRYHGLPFSLRSAVNLHRQFVTPWLLDSAPVVMGMYGFFLGRALDKIRLQLESRTESERRIRSVLNNLAIGVFVIDESGVIQKCNTALCAMFGYGEGDLVGQNIELLLPAERVDQQGEPARAHPLTRAAGEQREMQARRRDGRTFSIELVIGEMQCADARFLVGSITDVTQRKQLETQLHQAQRLESIGQLAAGVAHEINTPIQYVSDNLYVLKQNFQDLTELICEFRQCGESAPAECRERMRTVENNYDLEFILEDTPKAISQAIEGTGRISHIVRAMKDFSHIDRTKITAIDLNTALESTLTIAKNEYKYLADIHTDFGELPLVECYASELNQVFLNLIVNAAHAIGEKGPDRGLISLATRVVNGFAQVSVKDTGTGIPEQIRDRIFDPFFTTKEVGKGTGQGLHIAHQVVSKHGGRLWFESEEGQGTTFHLQIPLQLEQKPDQDA